MAYTTRDLELAERHVELGELHVVRQRLIVERLREDSAIFLKAKRLLELFETTQREYIRHRDSLRSALASPQQHHRHQ